MRMVSISEAKAQLSALIATVMTGKEVLICRAGRPVAKIVHYDRSEEPRRPGALTWCGQAMSYLEFLG